MTPSMAGRRLTDHSNGWPSLIWPPLIGGTVLWWILPQVFYAGALPEESLARVFVMFEILLVVIVTGCFACHLLRTVSLMRIAFPAELVVVPWPAPAAGEVHLSFTRRLKQPLQITGVRGRIFCIESYYIDENAGSVKINAQWSVRLPPRYEKRGCSYR